MESQLSWPALIDKHWRKILLLMLLMIVILLVVSVCFNMKISTPIGTIEPSVTQPKIDSLKPMDNPVKELKKEQPGANNSQNKFNRNSTFSNSKTSLDSAKTVDNRKGNFNTEGGSPVYIEKMEAPVFIQTEKPYRVLTKEFCAKLIESISKEAAKNKLKEKCCIQIGIQSGDKEVINFSQDISLFLRKSGFEIIGLASVSNFSPKNGRDIIVEGNDKEITIWVLSQ